MTKANFFPDSGVERKERFIQTHDMWRSMIKILRFSRVFKNNIKNFI